MIVESPVNKLSWTYVASTLFAHSSFSLVSSTNVGCVFYTEMSYCLVESTYCICCNERSLLKTGICKTACIVVRWYR